MAKIQIATLMELGQHSSGYWLIKASSNGTLAQESMQELGIKEYQ